MTDRMPGGMETEIPGGEGISIGSLGLDFVESSGRQDRSFRRIHCVSNPCTLKINEVVVGITSTDVLFHMNADETNANLEPGSRLARISQHMLQQRSYYPLFPAPSGMNLDLKFMNQMKMPCQPDLLIVPSKLACFAKLVLDSTVVINPGCLARGTTGGTYAAINVHPIKRETLENAGGDDVELHHSVHDRTLVDIKRI
jgi:DNA polymerase alpha subunit B